MKIICLGDFHITARRPSKRLDDYVAVQERKIDHMLSVVSNYRKEGIIILQPGDFFDRPTEPYWICKKYIQKFRNANIPIFAVAGQHDQRYHSTKLDNTPFAVLQAAGVIHTLGSIPHNMNNVHLYGKSWSEDIPKIQDSKAINILVCHEMVVLEKLWEEQEDYTDVMDLMKDTHFDLIVCGDNHQYFTYSEKDRFVINCGSLMRFTVAQTEHEPCFYLFDTNGIECPKKFNYEIESPEKIFDLKSEKIKKEMNEKLESFVQKLGTGDELSDIDFLKNLEEYTKSKEIDFSVKEEINFMLSETPI